MLVGEGSHWHGIVLEAKMIVYSCFKSTDPTMYFARGEGGRGRGVLKNETVNEVQHWVRGGNQHPQYQRYIYPVV